MPTFVPIQNQSSGPSTGTFVPIGGSKKKKKKGKSWFGGLTNAVHDVEDATVGAVAGTVTIGKAFGSDIKDDFNVIRGKKGRAGHRTTDIAKAIGKSYADYYGPLAHGDINQFLDNVYEHPVNLVLDATTVASLGLTGAAKVGIIASKGGKALELTMANGEKVVTKPLAKGELRARLQSMAANAKNAEVKVGPYHRPAGMQAAKVQRTKTARQSRNVQAQNAAFNRELRKLRGKPDKVAAFLLGRFDRQSLNEYMGLLRTEAQKNPKGPAAATLKLIENPRVQKRFDAPTPKVAKVLDEARALGEKQKGLLGIDDATAEAARYRPARIAGGARLEGEEWVGGPSIAELKARGLDPIYFPDTDAVKPPILSFNSGGGKGLPKAPGATRQNTGALMMAGQLIHDPAVLNKSWLEAVKFQHYKDTHSSLIEMATESPDIPHGYQAIRELPSERVPHMDKTRGEFLKAIDDEGVFRQDAPSLTTKSPDTAARIENGNYLIVPDKVVKQMTGEFTRQNDFIRLMNRYPLKVWRALVLGLRPAWLVNNVLGNTLMYLVHSARPNDLRALAGAFKEFASPKQHRLIDQILDKHFAGQTQGGFVASEFPSFSPEGIGRYGSRLQKSTAAVGRAGAAVAAALPRIDKRWEQALRKAKVKAELKRHPGLKAKVERMGRDVDYFVRLDKVLEGDPAAVEAIYDRVNDALGNFDSMTPAERSVLRSLFPFYSWFKAIVGVTGKLTLEQPLKVNLMGHLGQIAIESALQEQGIPRDEWPQSLLGMLGMHKDADGRISGYSTAGLNPYGTVAQIGAFAAAVASGKPGEAGRALPGLNPFLSDLDAYITGQTPQGYEMRGVGSVEGLPFTRLLKAYEATYGTDIPLLGPASTKDPLYDHDFKDEFLRYLGVPYVRASKDAAERLTADR